MRLKGILITLVILLSLLFALFNWQVLAASVPLTIVVLKANFPRFIGLKTIQFPIGLGLLISGVLLSLIFFMVSLIDRAGQLRQISRLEKQMEKLRGKLEQKRLEELKNLENLATTGFSELKTSTEENISNLAKQSREVVEKLDSNLNEKMKDIESKILLVRNEIAAHVAKTEDNIKKQVKEMSKS